MLRAKWLAMGVPVGFWWGWKKSNVWEVEKMVESVLPGAVARHVVDLLPKGTADTRQKVRLQESIRENGRRQEETIRKLEEAMRRQDENAARQKETIRLLQAVLAQKQQDSPTTTTAQKEQTTIRKLEETIRTAGEEALRRMELENAARQEQLIRQVQAMLAQKQDSPTTTTPASPPML